MHQPSHLISAKQFTKQMLESLFKATDFLRDLPAADRLSLARGRLMATLFYEPSTRTRLSFEAAMLRLGGQVVSCEDAANGSSAAKGETLEDVVRVVGTYADVLVIRHPEKGSVKKAAEFSPVPVINAGDGEGEHPTQALLDLYTIQRETGRLEDLRIVLAGDLLRGRTAHSLCLLLAALPGVRVNLISPADLTLPGTITGQLAAAGVKVEASSELKDAVKWDPDVLYLTRMQTERSWSKLHTAPYRITEATMDLLPDKTVLMHPLPRREEIAASVDSDSRAAYFRQAENGLYVRCALLYQLLCTREF